jgi:hypothetical protein
MQAAGNVEPSAGLQRSGLRTLELEPPALHVSELRQIVREASRALALLDAVRLEELAIACQKLNRDLPSQPCDTSAALALQAQQASNDMAVFARVLDATRANLEVMRRLGDLREGRLEYHPAATPESLHGHD